MGCFDLLKRCRMFEDKTPSGRGVRKAVSMTGDQLFAYFGKFTVLFGLLCIGQCLATVDVCFSLHQKWKVDGNGLIAAHFNYPKMQ